MRDDGRRDVAFPMQSAKHGLQGRERRKSRGLSGRGYCRSGAEVSNAELEEKRVKSHGRLEGIRLTYFSWEGHDAMLLFSAFSFVHPFSLLGPVFREIFYLALMLV